MNNPAAKKHLEDIRKYRKNRTNIIYPYSDLIIVAKLILSDQPETIVTKTIIGDPSSPNWNFLEERLTNFSIRPRSICPSNYDSNDNA